MARSIAWRLRYRMKDTAMHLVVEPFDGHALLATMQLDGGLNAAHAIAQIGAALTQAPIFPNAPAADAA